MQKAKKISALQRDIAACRICASALPHTPRPVVRLSSTARIVVAGQAPGRKVHDTGIPFNDLSGDRLRQWMGINRDVFYDQGRLAIVPMGFCYPGTLKGKGDLPPRLECRAAWHDDIFAAMPQVETILVIGRYAQDYHLGDRAKDTLAATVKAAEDYLPRYFPLPHPSPRNMLWLRKNPWFERDTVPKLRKIVQALL